MEIATHSLDGAIVLVTGASRGVGRATALRFANEGLTVVAVARDGDRLEAVAAEAGRARGEFSPSPGDVREAADAARITEEVERDVGPIDILINNAGIERVKPVETVSDVDTRRWSTQTSGESSTSPGPLSRP